MKGLLAALLLLAGCDPPPPVVPAPVVVAAPALPAPVAVPAAAPAPTAPRPARIPAAAVKYRPILEREIAFYWGLRQDRGVFFGQVHQESRWVPTAQSVYAAGLTQFTPSTAEWIQGLYAADLKATCGEGRGCPYDPHWALRAMVLYDKRLWASYDFAAPEDRWAFTLAAYNGGAGWLTKERAVARAAGRPGTGWFHDVEHHCVRRADACTESRHYPRVILHEWAPLYRSWVR